MFITGISGGSASGKSTLAAILRDRLDGCKVGLFSSDAYFRKPLPKMISPVTGEEGFDYNSPECVDFAALTDDIRAAEDGGDDVLIVEGAYIFVHEPLRELLDLKIFIDLPTDLRLYRRIKRNMAVRGLSMEEIADYYTDFAHFHEEKYSLPSKIYADIICNGVNFQNKAADMITDYIKKRI